jgi:hypothetical protein
LKCGEGLLIPKITDEAEVVDVNAMFASQSFSGFARRALKSSINWTPWARVSDVLRTGSNEVLFPFTEKGRFVYKNRCLS